ncbi:MAG: PAS domain S-box protein [Bradyrhizobium sp.]|uniref:PAS-domain containing protein n=1 Tax=Bradyrhizobium sp. TaxID=376 RepID=UPI00121608C6|nr:PAS-domain containing protein [Bradyrhizobium sp.]THD45598.1 MAG: PAS domain S-box protein [Bradyrhizobium sp.]
MPLATTPTSPDLDFKERLGAELERRTAVTPAMVHSIDGDGRLISVSDAWLSKLGYTREEVLGRLSSDFLTPESRDYAVRDVLPEFFRIGRCENVQYQMVRKDGSVIDVLLSGVLDSDPFGGGCASLAVITDVTALTHMKRQLAESEAKYRGLVEDQSELVSLATPEGELKYVNQAYAAFYRKLPEEMIGRNLFEFVPRESHAALAEHFRTVCATKHSVEVENQVTLPTGERRWLAWTNRALTDGDGRVTAIHLVGRDIEERVLAKQRLQESEARYRMLADNNSDMVFQLDHELVRRYVSPACRELLGYEPEEMIGVKPLSMAHPDDAPRLALVFQTLMNGSAERQSIVNRIRHREGKWIWVEAKFRALKDPETGAVTGIIGALRDISDILKSKALLHSTLTALSEGVVVQDANGRIISFNPAAERILGVSHGALLGACLEDLCCQAIREDGRDFPSYQHPSAVALATGEPQNQAVMGLRRSDGAVTWISGNSAPIFVEGSSELNSVVTSFSDITARKLAQEVLTEAVGAIPDGFVIYDNNDRLVTCNEAYKEIYPATAPAIKEGVSFPELLQYGLDRGQYPEAGQTKQQQSKWLTDRIERHLSSNANLVQQLPDGRWLQIRERRTPSGYIVGFRTDVTEFKRETAKLQAAIDNFPGGISFFDADYNIVAWNPTFVKLLGLPEELLQNGPPSLERIFRTNAARGEYGPGDPDEQVRARMELARKGEAHSFERTRPDGTVLEVRGTPIKGGGFVTTYTDVTKRHADARQLSESEHRAQEKSATLQLTLAHMSHGLSMFDASGHLIVWNDRYVEIYGMSPELIRQGVSIHSIIEHRRQAGNLDIDADVYVSELRQKLIDEGKSASTARLKDGRTISVVNTSTADGGWVEIHDDITERVRNEEDLFAQATELARINMRFDAALSNMTQGLSLFDADKRLVIANGRFRELYGLPEELVTPGTPLPLILQHHTDRGAKRELTLDEQVRAISTLQNQIILSADGREISIKRTPTADGGWVSTHEDVTARRAQEKLVAEKAAELELMNMQFNAALSSMAQGLCMFDSQKRLVVCNARYVELYQVPPDLLKVGTPYEVIITDRLARGVVKGDTSEPAVRKRAAELTHMPTNSRRVDELADGRFVLLARQPMEGGGWLAVAEDITERRRAEAEIVHLARHDVLTGLANRAEFNARLDEASKRLKRNGGAVTVMMLDLDKFKAVNDTLGHPAGDKLLVEVARRLKSSVREMDVLARLGGDEFAIIQEGGPNQHEGAIALALRIISAITQPFDLDGHQASVGTSIGIALAPEHGVEPEELLKSADLALYNVKSSGRNDFRVFEPEMLEVAHTHQSAESELREGIAREEFELHYQPIADAKTRQLCGVEALVRWRHPTKGLIGPDKFIPLAESTGLIVPLGDWVLHQACKDAVSWPAHIKVAINISALQFKKGNLFDVILCTLVETGLAAERLELEITETALLENQDAHLATIRRLKNLGISIALDDFGTGYSSMNYLTIYPFDKIKIDKSFTQGVLDRRDCKAVVASTLALAKGLGTVTTAEGIETEEQLEYMREAGVDLVQGYLLGRPVPVSQLDIHDASQAKEMVA